MTLQRLESNVLEFAAHSKFEYIQQSNLKKNLRLLNFKVAHCDRKDTSKYGVKNAN